MKVNLGVDSRLHGALIKLIEDNVRELSKENEIHVTELIAPPCIRKETRSHYDEIEIDPGTAIATLNGIIGHSILENSTDNSVAITEFSINCSIANMRVLGRVDALTDFTLQGTELHATLIDYKTTNADSFKYLIMDGAKDEWIQQLNIYKYILETQWSSIKPLLVQRAEESGFSNIAMIKIADSFVTDKAEVDSYALGWNKRKAMRDPTYPQIPIATFDIPLYANIDIEKYVKARMSVHMDPNYLPTDEEMWVRPWALMVEGRKTPIGHYSTEEKKHILLAKGQYWLLDIDDIVRDPAKNITRCAYCVACNVCQGKYYLKALATKEDYKQTTQQTVNITR